MKQENEYILSNQTILRDETSPENVLCNLFDAFTSKIPTNSLEWFRVERLESASSSAHLVNMPILCQLFGDGFDFEMRRDLNFQLLRSKIKTIAF
jgi:hypothetical protein